LKKAAGGLSSSRTLWLLITEGQLISGKGTRQFETGGGGCADAHAGHRRRLKKDHDVRTKQIQYIIDEVEDNKRGAFVPLHQQPVAESSLYGLVALLQYLYMN